MKNVKNKTKIILFAILLVVMILPFSNIEMIDAAKSEKADKKDDSKKKEAKDKDEKKSKDKDDSKKKEKKLKEYSYDIKSNYVEKDLHNYEADKVLQKMQSFLMVMPNTNNTAISTNGPMASSVPQALSIPLDMREMDKLQDELEKVTKDHKGKIIDKNLRKDLKKARQLISNSDIPTLVLATGIDHLYIQLSKENAKYEEQIIKIMKNVPYKIEYGEGFKKSACISTESDCNYEIGGIKIQVKTSPIPFTENTCSLSIPMNKDGVPGFLTVAHCFNGYSENVYQPDISSESNIIGISNSTWRSHVDNGECDCAWIKDTSSVEQRAGVYAIPNYYWAITSTHVPSIGENAMLRGVHNNNGEFYYADEIEYDDVEIEGGLFGITTKNLMSFVSPSQQGDSGGAVFYGNSYIGIVIGGGQINGTMYTAFIPWDHITENISGLSLTPHP